jgi:hypothetical protein
MRAAQHGRINLHTEIWPQADWLAIGGVMTLGQLGGALTRVKEASQTRWDSVESVFTGS